VNQQLQVFTDIGDHEMFKMSTAHTKVLSSAPLLHCSAVPVHAMFQTVISVHPCCGCLSSIFTAALLPILIIRKSESDSRPIYQQSREAKLRLIANPSLRSQIGDNVRCLQLNKVW